MVRIGKLVCVKIKIGTRSFRDGKGVGVKWKGCVGNGLP